MKINLATKIIATLFFLSCVLFTSLSFFSLNSRKADLIDAFSDRARATVFALQSNINSKEDAENRDKLLLNIQKIIWLDSEIKDVSFNMLQEEEMITYISNDALKNNQLADAKNKEAFSKNIFISEVIGSKPEETLRVIAPLLVSGQPVGTIEVNFLLEGINREIQRVVIFSIEIYSIMILAFLLVAYLFISHIIIKPLLEIKKAMENFSKGQFFKLEIKTNDELEELNETFNKMANSLSKIKKDIEEKIEKRTADLEKINRHMIGRELKMIELKKRMAKLENKNKSNAQ